MPKKMYVMFDNCNIQTWKRFLVSFKMYTWFTEKKTFKTNKNKNKKQKTKKYKIKYESRIKSRIFVE